MKNGLRALALAVTLCFSAGAPALAQEHGGSPEAAEHDLNWFTHAPGVANPLGWNIIDFVVMLGLIVFLARKPLAQFLGKRRSDIAEQLAEAQQMKAAAEAKFAEFERRRAGLDEELAKLKEEIVRSGEAERERILAEAEIKAARLNKDADFVIEQRLKQLRVELRGEMVEAAIAAAEKVLREKTSDADQERLAKDFVAKLGPLAKTGKVQQ